MIGSAKKGTKSKNLFREKSLFYKLGCPRTKLKFSYGIESVIFGFHRKPKWNLGFETELPVSTYLLKITVKIDHF